MAQSWLVFQLTSSAFKLVVVAAFQLMPRLVVHHELYEGVRYVQRREALWVPVLIAYAVAALAMAYSRLMPVFATQVLHAGVRAYGWLLAAPGAGALASSLWVASRGRRA